MQVACSRCKTRYKIPSEKLEAGPIKVRCKECDHIFGVRKKERPQPPETPPETVAAVAAAPAASQSQATPPPEEELLSDDEFGAKSPDSASRETPAPDESDAESDTEAGTEQGTQEEPQGDDIPDAFGFGELEFGSTHAGDADDQLADGAEEQTGSDEQVDQEEQIPPGTMEFDLSDFDSSVFDDDDAEATLSADSKGAEKTEEADKAEADDVPFGDSAAQEEDASEAESAQPEGFDTAVKEFDINAFQDMDSAQSEGESESEGKLADEGVALAASESEGFSDNTVQSFFNEAGGDFSDNELGGFASNEPQGFPRDEATDESLEQVEIDDLLTPPPADLSGEQDQVGPRLDLRKGDRRTESIAKPTDMPLKKKGFPVLLALLLSAAIGTAAFLGYNTLIQRDAAFYFLNPESIMQWFQSGQLGNVLKLTEPVEGAYLDRPDKERLYVVSGWITNVSSVTKNAIEVKGAIFGPDGAKVGEATSYCGNVVSQEELMALDGKEIASRLMNAVGTASTPLEIKPDDKARFMVVFFSPPQGVGKFTVEVASSREPSKEAEKK